MSGTVHQRRHIARGAVWRIVEVMGAEIFAFGAFIISARLLLPTEVGIVAQATLFIMTAQLLLHQGLGEALIQSDAADVPHFSSAFWLNLAIGVAAALLLMIAADPIGYLLSEPGLPPVLQALAPTLVLFAASGIYQAKLRRELQLRGFAFASISASLAGGLVAVTLAWRGYGVWSLVAQQWTYASISLAVFAACSGWLPAPAIRWRHVRRLGAFGGLATMSAFLQFAMRRLDLLILGIFLPSGQVGLFSVANRLMLSAGMLTYYSIQQIGLPVLSRLAHDRAAHLEAIGRTLRLVSLFCLPTLVGLALVADILIPLALGEKWQGSVRPFQVLSAFGIFFALSLISGQILLSAGFAGLFVRLSFTNVVMFLIAVTLAAPYGLVAAAFAGGVANMLAVPVYGLALHRTLGVNLRDCALDQWPIWTAAGMMVTVVLIWSHLAGGAVGDVALLAGRVVAGGGTFLVVVMLLSYKDVKEIYGSFAEMLHS
ncbi:MAG: lipopolysaccharide biosynthesis protein [Alphaproteobacteria bacterium]|nr:lipopolysaccharide biosynthesis protein [Alphaproteobacteria bacterium]